VKEREKPRSINIEMLKKELVRQGAWLG
jgi:hypothetical protein